MEGFKIEEINGVAYLSGKVDSTNAPSFEEQLGGVKGEDLILDLSDFEYISSAGLRVLLKRAKEKKEHFRLVNVPDAVYEVFEMTGFTNILDITRKKRSISIDGCTQIGQGACGKLYRLDPETIVKVFSKTTTDALIARELECSHQALIAGLPTAIAFDEVDVDGERGIVYELLDSNTLAKELVEKPDSFDELASKYVALLKKVHGTRVQSGTLPRTSDIYRGYLEYVSKWFTADEVATLERMISSIPERDTLVHGDFHAKNIMVPGGELTLIDMADTSIGNPLYDLLGMTITYYRLPHTSPQACERYTGLPSDVATRLWNRFLSLYFDEADEAGIATIESCLIDYMSLKLAFAPALGAIDDEERLKGSLQRSRELLIPRMDEIIEKNKEIVERYF